MSILRIPTFCLAFFAAPLLAQTTTTFFPATPVPGVKPGPTPMHMPGVAPLFIEGRGFSSSLVLVNPATKPVSATITLRGLDGYQLTTKQIVLEKGSRRSVSLSSLLETVQNAPISGSLSVLQDVNVPGMVVAAQLTILDTRNSTPAYIDEELEMPAMERASTILRGVADSAEGPALLAITNLEDSVQHVSLRCLGERNESRPTTFALAANATSVTAACSDRKIDSVEDYTTHHDSRKQRGVIGYEITGDGMPGMLAAFALAQHRHHDADVFSAVPFVDPKSLRSKNIIYVGVPFGAQTVLSDGIYVPRVALTNFSAQPAHITIETSSGRAQGAEDNSETAETITPKALHILLSAGESKDVILDGEPESTGLQHSVVIRTDRLPGEVQSKLVSRSDGRLYEVEMLAKDEKTPENGGGHPWVTRGGTESHLLLFNHRNAVKIFGVSISNGVTTWNKRYSVAALSTRQLSIDRIISDQVKDDDGNTLNPTYQEGVVSWSTANAEEGTGRLLVSNRNTAMARSFSCGYTLVVCGLGVSVFNGGIVPIFSFTEYSSAAPVQYCYAWGVGACSNLTQGSGGGAAFNWQLGNTNIVKYNTAGDQYSSSTNLRGVAKGSTWAAVTASENGCQSTGQGNPPPTAASMCFAQLKYRVVEILGVEVGNHSFWWFQDVAAYHWVTDAGPTGNCAPSCGFLDSWIVPGDIGHYSQDDAKTTSVAWYSPVGPSICNNSANIIQFQQSWKQNSVQYGFGTAPNSNTYAHGAANAAPFTVTTPPPNAPGW